jgi:hypothetical protein
VAPSEPAKGFTYYRWIDANGVVNYTQLPPPPGIKETPKSPAAREKSARAPDESQRSAQETPESAKTSRAVVDDALKALSSGNFDRLVSFYRMFEESWTPAYVAETRRLLKLYFTLMRDGLGRPTAFRQVESTAPLTIDPVPDRFWDKSDCVFAEHAFKATFVAGQQRRSGGVSVKVCYSPAARRAWLRAVTIVMGPVLQVTIGSVSSPPMDPAFEKVMTRYMEEVFAACERKALDPESCQVTAGKP